MDYRKIIREHTKLNLERYEGGEGSGHTIERHVGKGVEYLKGRVEQEPSLRKGATSFPDLRTANELTEEVVKQNAKDISDWAGKARIMDTKGFTWKFNTETGYGTTRDSNAIKHMTKVRVVFKKLKDGITIITSYPVE
ncbi:hypothetical protein MIDIC_290003 [Alphaproteobacteria bacterium]